MRQICSSCWGGWVGFLLGSGSIQGGLGLKVIPVIDILNGAAVHAVRGMRSEYKPLESILVRSAKPLEAACAFKTLGFEELYIADLDAIIDCSTDFKLLKRIAGETGLSLMVDAGVTSLERAQRLLESGVSKLIVGTETLANKSFVAKAVQRCGSDHVVLSLDLKGSSILVRAGFDGCTDPLCLLQEFKAMGISEVIVLDLNRVGSREGVNTAFLKKVISKTGLDVYAGGGVRNISDLVELNALGVSGVLVATALHTGKISVEDLKREGFL
jgi:HisA/HisF family protein